MIMHKVFYKHDLKGNYEGMFYLCNQSVGIREGNPKLTLYWDRVTCKNCLKQFVKSQDSVQEKKDE